VHESDSVGGADGRAGEARTSSWRHRKRRLRGRPGLRYFVVLREPGPAWDRARPMRDQDDWDAHAEFMDGLAEAGFIVLGGPLGYDGLRFMHVVDAASAEEAAQRFDRDPWTPIDRLRIASVDPWDVLLARD
jgi:hypothetical protein